MEPLRRLPVSFRGVRWIPLQRSARGQRRRGNFPVFHWSFQLLQLRQLGLSTFVRFLQHTLVLQRCAGSDFSYREIEDRALVYQWMAVLRQIQQSTGPWWTD